MSGISRRSFLRGAAAVGGAAALGPDLVGRFAAADPSRRSIPKVRGPLDLGGAPIEHVVVLTMENRSFDHFFASLRFDEGRTDVAGHDGPGSGFANSWTHTGGASDVFHLASSTCTRLDPPHEWESVRLQHHLGAEDGYLAAVEHHLGYEHAEDRAPDADEVMGYFTRRELPFSYAVADEYTICDAYHSPASGPTLPNRHYLHCGSAHGIWDNYLDSQPRGTTGPSPLGNPLVGFEWETIYDRIDAAALTEGKGHLDWRVYFVEAPFTMLYSNPKTTHPERFAPFHQFLTDAAAGNLASFTSIDPGYFTASDHSPQNVQLGQLFIASVYYALAASPVWDKTCLIVTYDEDGGYYDSGSHVLVPDERGSVRWNGTSTVAVDDWDPSADYPNDVSGRGYRGMLDEDGSPYRSGIGQGDPHFADFSLTGGRLPTMVMGPWVRGGNVDHTPMDHASILAFVTSLFGLDPGLSARTDFRLESGGFFTDGTTFDFGSSPRDPVVLDVPSFHASMFTDCNTLFTPATPYVEGPWGADNPGLDLNDLLRLCITSGAVPEVPADQVHRTYLDAFRLVEEATSGDLLGIRPSHR